MNPVVYGLKQVRQEIPKEVLDKIFLSNVDHRFRQATSVDTQIRTKVIEQRVLPDCNLVGGTEVYIDLSGLQREAVDPYTWIYRIPKERTQGRTITTVLSIGYGQGIPVGVGYMSPVRNNNALMDAAAGLLSSNSPIPMVSTAEIQLVGENTVMISNALTLPATAYLRCWLENDSNFNHLQPASYKDFAKLITLATKAYIWVNAQIPMDKSFIFAGNELGRFTQVVDSYSDANEQYETHFNEVWKKVAVFNDPVAIKRYHKTIMGGLW